MNRPTVRHWRSCRSDLKGKRGVANLNVEDYLQEHQKLMFSIAISNSVQTKVTKQSEIILIWTATY